ncbi:MAG: hypothetical protein IT313_08610 [Anaerolineales bacterium]|nr:hypothetical protein [Anaerolineales bacterium]
MEKSDNSLTIQKSLVISLIVFLVFLGYVIFLRFAVEPLPLAQDTERSTRSFEMLSVVLGLLAGGCMAGYFSFDYSRIHIRHKKGALLISWLFVSSIYLLIFLIMYGLRRAGALQIVDDWAAVLLFIAAYAFLDSLALFERWKMGQFQNDT